MKKGRNNNAGKNTYNDVLGKIKIPGVIAGARVNTVTEDDKEGEIYINVSRQSKTQAGLCFMPGFKNRFDSILGTMSSISEFIANLLYPEYSTRGRIKDSAYTDHVFEAARQGLRAVEVPNAAAIIAEAIWTRVQTLSPTARKVAMSALSEKSYTWTSFTKQKVKRTGLFVNASSVPDHIINYNNAMRHYLAILTDINTAVVTNDNLLDQHLAVYDVVKSLIVDDSIGFYAGVESLPKEMRESKMMDKDTFRQNVEHMLAEQAAAKAEETEGEKEDKPKAKKTTKSKAKKKTAAKKKSTVKAEEKTEEKPDVEDKEDVDKTEVKEEVPEAKEDTAETTGKDTVEVKEEDAA